MTLSAASAQTPATPNPPDAPAAPRNPIDPQSSVRALPSPPDAPAPASASDSAPSPAATQTPVSAAQGPAIQLAPEDDDVPMQSPILLGDSPKSAARKGGAVSLPRQSQIDVALDARTKKLRGAAVGGYGEAILTAPIGGNNPAVIDLRRTVLFFGYNFTDHIRFFSEVEYEHALTSGDAGGEVAIEQAMLDFMFRRYFNIRVGMGVLPVSLINIYHEPSTFNGAERPDVDLRIVPSTWQQMLAGFYGAVGPVRYQIFVTPGLSASGFSADTGIRGGRQENIVKTRDVGIVGRLDYSPFLGGNIGVSGYWARAGQGDVSLGDVAVTMAALDTKLSRFGLTLRGQFSYVYVSEVEGLNRALALSTPSAGPISRHLLGGYVELSYDLLRLVPHNLGFQLLAFGRYERTDTQLSVPDSGVGFVRKPGNDRTVYTAGLTFRPILEVAVKLDYQRRHTEVADSATDQLNAAIAYQF
ncbi:MAG TPA: hypothetical protein PKE31_06315 [Pseudomonadota bacterium]|nr:hypothetical protein [Pseudomonadota bacterium]